LANGGYSQAAPLKLVLIPDPNCTKPDDCGYGSYLVVAKLEQNVRRFHQDIIDLANLLDGPDQNEKINRAKALVIGRFPDGTPIALQKRDGGIIRSAMDSTIAQYPNNFGYPPAYPPNPGPCPFQTHIRRANPRNTQIGQPGEGNEETVRGRRIVRRGITYGKRNPEPKDHPRLDQLPTKDVGVLFMSFQASIAGQFEWIIVMWILYTSQRDAMVAAKPPAIPNKSSALICDQWPKKWDWDPEAKGPFPYGDVAVYRFQRHVTLKGGEYLFAPSLNFLRNIAGTAA
jgi:deferrochelatase/peroxidase EfeB